MGKRLAGWIVLVAVLVSVLDIGATYVALRSGIGEERNPLALAVMDTIGVMPTLAGGLVVRVVLVVALALIGTAAGYLVARRAAGVVLATVTLWWALIAFQALGVVTAGA